MSYITPATWKGVYDGPKREIHLNIDEPAKSVIKELQVLKKDGLIDQDTMVGAGPTKNLLSENADQDWMAEVTFWSERENAQWQAYRAEGTATGLQAADYQQQWLTERRQLTTEYLDQIFTLADSFEDLDLDAGMFSTLFRGSLEQEDGQPVLPSNMSPDEAESVELFWNQNQEKIAELEKSLSKLVEFPSDLDGWLSSQDEPVAEEVHQLVDRMKNAWIDGSDQIDNSFRPMEVWYGSSLPSSEDYDNAMVVDEDMSGLWVEFKKYAPDAQEIQDYTIWNDISGLFEMAAARYMKQENQILYQEMSTLVSGLYSEFDTQFGRGAGFSDFSLQDMVDNYLAGKPLAQMDDGRVHPDFQAVESFWENHELALLHYSDRQERLNTPPKMSDLNRYMADNRAAIERYMMTNLDSLLTQSRGDTVTDENKAAYLQLRASARA